ncbi:acyl carrier protein [Pseudomonas sp. RIT-To-2]|uniref:acyl carrier protein n=1 Tax=Pseudomonas sp. RIT-To-2 TaxID=3462541 RepID=UPI0024138B4C
MPRFGIRRTVHNFITEYIGDRDFDDDVALESLGLDKKDIMELITRLEDEYGLTAFTVEEDKLLEQAVTANDLWRFLDKIARQ